MCVGGGGGGEGTFIFARGKRCLLMTSNLAQGLFCFIHSLNIDGGPSFKEYIPKNKATILQIFQLQIGVDLRKQEYFNIPRSQNTMTHQILD